MAELRLVSNRSEAVRHETLHGRDYLVAPVVAVRAGVLNGEFAPVEEIGRFVEDWNGIPVPLGHPMLRGMPISANSPEIVAKSPARFFHAEMVDDRLRGEIWIDVIQAQELGGDWLVALEKLEKGEGIEVSTAYYRDFEASPGVLNGLAYVGIQRNLRPDHLALLLHQVGACSWKDGCGVPRVNSENSLRINGHTGVMIALFPSAEAAARLALSAEQLPEGVMPLPPSEMHLTLGYLGDLEKGEVMIEQARLMDWVMSFSRSSVLVRGQVNGVARFLNAEADGTNALVALFDCEYLSAWRNWLVDGMPIKRNHAFTPHLTLAYLPADTATPDLRFAPVELVFDRIGVAWGEQVTLFPLQGEAMDMSAEVANTQGFNPTTLARKALNSLAHLLGFPTKPEAVETLPVTNQVPAGNQSQPTEEVPMERAELIKKLAANSNCPFDQGELEAMPDSALTKLEQKLESGCPGSNPAANAVAPAANAAQEVSAVTAELVMPEELKQLSALVQEMGGVEGFKKALGTVQANASQRKADLVAELTANERCAFASDELLSMPVDQLEKLAASLRPADYTGRGGPRSNAQAPETHEVPAPPAIVLAKPE